ncbi:MAG: hypothetical protein ACFFF4_00165 [Candidatus Thorarchaeota archaeon]
MADGTNTDSSSISIDFVDDPAVVFRVAWYAVSRRPGVYLTKYSEPESKEFQGNARFSVEINGHTLDVIFSIEEGSSQIQLEVSGSSVEPVNAFAEELSTTINEALDKYRVQNTEDKGRVRRALVAKTCWDRLVYLILKKHPMTEVYYQLAHGREMMIKATEGEDLHPITLSTSGWLSKIEPLPKDEALPGNIAAALAKKSVEWKRDTVEVIQRYL